MDDERSKSGSWIKRYDQAIPGELVKGDTELIDRVGDHVEKYVGEFDVLHEIVSPHIHLDIFHVPPTEELSFHSYVTCGVSEKPMSGAPEGSEFMELIVLLPSNWPVSQKDFNDEANWWPLRELKALGRFPHEYATWFGYGHTIGHGDPPEPFHASTQLCGSLISTPFSLPPDFYRLSAGDRVTHFYGFCPLYAEEMQLKLDSGLDELLELFDRYDIGNVIDPHRVNVVTGKVPTIPDQTPKKKWWNLRKS